MTRKNKRIFLKLKLYYVFKFGLVKLFHVSNFRSGNVK